MFRLALACCCALAAGLAPAAAQTSPPSPAPVTAAPSPEAAKLAAAMSKVTSFRIQLSSPMGMAGTVTVLLPAKRTKALMAMGAMTNEMVMADGRMYTRSNGGDWHVSDLPAGGGAMTDATLKAMGDPSKFHVLPDRVENGTTVGVYEVVVPAPPGTPAGTPVPPLSCTYDKTTYLPRTCGFQSLTQTFEGWNDPANVVDIPVVASPKP